jgi:SAM-dependent methyltransferase
MVDPLMILYPELSPSGSVLDLGCLGFRQVGEAAQAGRPSMRHSGVDYVDTAGDLPPGFVFKKVDLAREPIPFEDDAFDLVVGSHIIEHLPNPVDFFGECVRVCKPNGRIYIETPSERSLWLPGMPFGHDLFFSLSFYDDPTHTMRPWTPQSLHRLTRYWGCEPVMTGRITSWKHQLGFPLVMPWALLTRNAALLEKSCRYGLGWSSFLIARKPENAHGRQPFNYYLPPNRSYK